ncbi:hypothetical protein Hanom_Chr17g01530761 [Helianthus anomalus]
MIFVTFSLLCIISRAWISTSIACPLAPPSGWWIMILVFGIAKRLPLVPPPRIMEAVDADMPSAIVDTSARNSFRISYMAIEALFDQKETFYRKNLVYCIRLQNTFSSLQYGCKLRFKGVFGNVY